MAVAARKWRWNVAALIPAMSTNSSVAFILVPGRRAPQGNAEYAALGSSFAAGLGLGPRVEGSAVVAGRTTNSYPQKFARLSGLSLVDMTWSGSKPGIFFIPGRFFSGRKLMAWACRHGWSRLRPAATMLHTAATW